MIPCVTQKLGTRQNHQRSELPSYWVWGMICRVITMMDMTPEIRKLMAKMMICALVSLVKKKVKV